MKNTCLVFCLFISGLIPSLTGAQESGKSSYLAETAASPEMDRLAKALAGEWNTSESMMKSQFFPNGGSRHGGSHIRLVADDTSLFAEFHSNGSAGKLDGLYVIWWDKPANIYRVFVCFNDSKSHITPNSHSLIAAMDAGDGNMKALITTTSTRR